MYKYKLKGVSIAQDENGFNFIKIRMVERFKDGKYDKFIPMREAIKILDKAVFNEKDFNSVMSKAEKKRNQNKLF